MILLLDLSYRAHSLSRDEFVGPIAHIVIRAGQVWRERHYSEMRGVDREEAAGIILCGTALKDNLFATRVSDFFWLRDISVPVLGICAGMEVLCLIFGGTIRPGCEIGMTGIKADKPDPLLPGSPAFQAYELHSFSCDPPPGWGVMAISDGGVQAVCHPDRPIFGVMFHPEVRNEAIVERFLSLCVEISR